jgi:DNA-directed RNA polymerase specialized sigma24 family protein
MDRELYPTPIQDQDTADDMWPEDDALITHDREQDPQDAAHEYLAANQTFIFNMVRKIGTPNQHVRFHDYDDVGQEMMAKILEKPHYVEPNVVGALACKPLTTLVTNHYYDKYTAKAGWIRSSMLVDFTDVADASPLVSRNAMASMDEDDLLRNMVLYEVIGELSEPDRQLLWMQYFEGRSQDEIVGIAEDVTTVSALKARLRRIRAQMARLLAERGIDSFDDIAAQ